MAQFSYSDYQVMAANQTSDGTNTKIGYFRLKNDGDIAVARINLSTTEELDFASVHTIGTNGRWIKVSCLNPLGSYTGSCPLCSAYTANPKGAVSKATQKVFIQMLVSYRDPSSATGYTPPAPVIWDRPAAFSRELANKLMVAGNLRNTLVLITRNGKAGDMKTTYSMDILPAEHPVFKPEMIPTDFSAFENFNIAKHSYWEKSVEEINAYLTTGQFPEKGQNLNGITQGVNNTVSTFANAATEYIPNIPSTPTTSYASTAYAPAVDNQQYPGAAVNTPQVFTAAPPTIAQAHSAEAPNASAPARDFSGFHGFSF